FLLFLHLLSFPTRRSSDLSLPSFSSVKSGWNSALKIFLPPFFCLPFCSSLFVAAAITPSFGLAIQIQWTRMAGQWPVEASPLVRSEEHTSELQSRFDLVCR